MVDFGFVGGFSEVFSVQTHTVILILILRTKLALKGVFGCVTAIRKVPLIMCSTHFLGSSRCRRGILYPYLTHHATHSFMAYLSGVAFGYSRI